MPKRKRDSESALDAENGTLSVQQQRIQHKLKQGTIKLGHAFKVAKGFERQKLGRRRKNAVSHESQKDVQRIDAEIAALKTLDTTACAQHYLYKTLSKIKAVAVSPKLPPEVTKPTTLSQDAAFLNVNARLCNSNPVKDALPAILTGLQSAMGIQGANSAGHLRAKRSPVDTAEQAKKGSNGPSNPSDETSLSGVNEREFEDSLSSGESDDDLEVFNSRLAPSEDSYGSDNDDPGADVGDLEKQLAADGIRQKESSRPNKTYDHMADLSFSSENDQTSRSASLEPQKAPMPKKSAFLPSLTMGGYISGSGSDIDDEIDAAPKKNRRGQRARQALWEKKYGSKAKHLQKSQRNDGWDPKRGATDEGQRPRQHKGNLRAKDAQKGRHLNDYKAVVRSKPAAERHRDDSGPIHPSWEAAKKAKERRDLPVAFQGKKMTFD